MGMYTELSVSAELKDLTELEINALMWMVGEIDQPSSLPNHELFKCDRCEYMLRMRSYYFPFTIDPVLKLDPIDNQYRLVTRSNMKNYEGEIELFIDWLKPFIDCGVGINNMFAVVCHEEQEEPTLYYK